MHQLSDERESDLLFELRMRTTYSGLENCLAHFFRKGYIHSSFALVYCNDNPL